MIRPAIFLSAFVLGNWIGINNAAGLYFVVIAGAMVAIDLDRKIFGSELQSLVKDNKEGKEVK